MFVICREGHLGFYSEGNIEIFVEENSAILPNRKLCLNYLMKFMDKEKAVDTITILQKKPMTWYSF